MISEPSKIWVFPKIGEPQNGWFIMENPIKMGWFEGTTVFGNIHMFAESFSGEHNFPEVDQSKFSRKWPWRNICLFCKESVFKRNHPWKETKQKKQPMSKLEHHLSPKKHDDYIMIATSQWNAKACWTRAFHMMSFIWFDPISSRSPGPFPPCSCGPDHVIRSESQKTRRKTPGCFVCYRLFQNNFHGFRFENGEKKNIWGKTSTNHNLKL